MPETHMLERNGCPLHFWLDGPPDAPLIALTHGATLDHRTFDMQVAALTPRYRTLTWDVRGHGQSQPMGAPFSVKAAADDLVALLDELGVDQATLLGHSMGGALAQELVFRYPERVAALVIIGSTCITLPRSRLAMLAPQAIPLFFRLYPYQLSKRQLARTMSIRPEFVAAAEQMMDQVPRADFVRIWSDVMSCLHSEPGYRITQPLLVTYGEHDMRAKLFAQQASIWQARDPACQVAVIPDAGHNANQDNPDCFNRVLLEFLTKRVYAYG
jgi:pimeloyl-ACP methyl ester carboxylesterase